MANVRNSCIRGEEHGIAGALISRMPPIERLSRIERFYWRAIWLLVARCLRAWMIADAMDSRPLRS
jgi:hypothetical protein